MVVLPVCGPELTLRTEGRKNIMFPYQERACTGRLRRLRVKPEVVKWWLSLKRAPRWMCFIWPVLCCLTQSSFKKESCQHLKGKELHISKGSEDSIFLQGHTGLRLATVVPVDKGFPSSTASRCPVFLPSLGFVYFRFFPTGTEFTYFGLNRQRNA